ncbi:MAG: Holliday junction resolvase RuvX [Fluviicola sp.]|jgi:putative Holliday junction resolvase
MSKVLAIDFGLKRTGLALSDERKMFAFGLKTVDSRNLMDELKKLVVTEQIDTLVVGEPKRLDASDTHISENVRRFVNALKQNFPGLIIHSLDERFTSKMAASALSQMGMQKKVKQDKGLIDEVSATILLQDFLANHL